MADKIAAHPYFPRTLHLPHFKPNDKDVIELLAVFFGIVGIFVLLTWFLSGWAARMPLSLSRRLIVCWFVACGLIHTILEGYFGYFHSTLAGHMDFLGQLWKEYGKGDSRYISSDTCMVTMERITAAFDGPLAFLAAYAFLRNSSYRYIAQLVLSLCQIYGDTLYFLTEVFEEFSHSEYNHPIYFWFYFVFLNSLWIVIPSCLVADAVRNLSKSQSIFDGRTVSVKNNKKYN